MKKPPDSQPPKKKPPVRDRKQTNLTLDPKVKELAPGLAKLKKKNLSQLVDALLIKELVKAKMLPPEAEL